MAREVQDSKNIERMAWLVARHWLLAAGGNKLGIGDSRLLGASVVA
jgi:hypothetical protein